MIAKHGCFFFFFGQYKPVTLSHCLWETLLCLAQHSLITSCKFFIYKIDIIAPMFPRVVM